MHPFFSKWSPATVDCCDKGYSLTDLKEKLEGIVVSRVIQQRSGIIIQDNQQKQSRVCENHFKFYVKNFENAFNQKNHDCKYPNHRSKNRRVPLTRRVTFYQSQQLLQKENIFMPYDCRVCAS